MRQIFGIFTAFVAAFLILLMTQLIWESMFPFPVALDIDDVISLTDWMSNLPTKAYIIIGVSHVLAIFFAGFISALVAGRSRMTVGIITVFIAFVGVIIYLFTYNFPTWFVATDTALTAIIGFGGVVLGSQSVVRDN